MSSNSTEQVCILKLLGIAAESIRQAIPKSTSIEVETQLEELYEQLQQTAKQAAREEHARREARI